MDLLNTCKKRDTAAALDVIKNGNFDDRITDKNGNTALMVALMNRMPEVASELIKSNKCDRHVKNRFGLTALMISCKNRMPDTALQLLRAGKSSPGRVNYRGDTALTIACRKKLPEVAVECIKLHPSKCKPGHADQQGNTALMLAFKNGLNEVAQALVATKHRNLSQCNKQGKNALKLAFAHSNWIDNNAICGDATLELLNFPSSVDSKYLSEMLEQTIMQRSSDNKLDEIFHKILNDYAHLIDFNYTTCTHTNTNKWCFCRRDSLLMTACYCRRPDLALRILEFGRGKLNLDHQNRCGNTALIFACRYKQTDVALALLEEGASPEIVGEIHNCIDACCGSNTALMIACKLNMPDVALKILSSGRSNYDFVDYNRSALDYAIVNENDMHEVILNIKNLMALNGSTESCGRKYISYQ
jgi:ankyrin repeat protein